MDKIYYNKIYYREYMQIIWEKYKIVKNFTENDTNDS